MRHFIHRHEPPVPAGSITVIGQSEDAVAVCKPHGMPVHVGGQYRKNTVLGILTAEQPDLGPLLPIHR
jgi:23S rRNA-/tRNA-specific pseudouridylate synthase